MALYEDIPVRLAIDSINIFSALDRLPLPGHVEPYVIPIFFKIDGDNYTASIDIADGDDFIELNVQRQDGIQSVTFDNTTNLLTIGNSGNSGFGFTAGETVVFNNLRFDTTLKPIPFEINILGLFDQEDILDIVGQIGDVQVLLLDEFTSELIANLFGLDVESESCPESNVSDFLNTVEAQFDCLIPGTVGGLFLTMENDGFDDNDVAVIGDVLSQSVQEAIDEITESITISDPIPDANEPEIDFLDLGVRLTAGLLLRFDFSAWFSLTTSLGLITGAPDDYVGHQVIIFDHKTLPAPDSIEAFNTTHDFGGNRWSVNGSIRRT